MIVCGRLNRQRTSATPLRSATTATAGAEREHGGDGHERGRGGGAEHEAGGEAQRAGGRLFGPREVGGGRGAGRPLGAADGDRVRRVRVRVPVGREGGCPHVV